MCVGLIVTTYIPFFFLTILAIFTVVYILFYRRLFLDFLKRSFQFFNSHKLLTIFCTVFLLVSCIPVLVFYQESKSGEFVVPNRHAGANSASAVAVGVENVASGDIISHGYFDRIFYDHAHIDMGDIFIPYLFFLILLCATFGPVNKLVFFLLFNILALSLITITSAAGVYHFLYTHILFFKFIRNIYYFFWLAMLPMGVLLSVAAFKSFLTSIDASAKKTGWLIYIIVCHAAFIWFLFLQGGVLAGAWGAVVVIFLYFLVYFYFKKNISRPVGFCLFMVAVFIQSVQVYGCLGDKLLPVQQEISHPKSIQRVSANIANQKHPDLYYALRWFTVLFNNIEPRVLGSYKSHPFILYDNVFPYADSQESLKVLEKAMAANANIAYVSKFESHLSDYNSDPDASSVADVDPIASGRLSLLNSDPNSMRIKMHLATRQFLVINNNYHSDWHAFINGREVPLLRANVAFKGLWIPAGDSMVVLRFSHPLRYVWHYLLIALYWGTFVYFLVLLNKPNKRNFMFKTLINTMKWTFSRFGVIYAIVFVFCLIFVDLKTLDMRIKVRHLNSAIPDFIPMINFSRNPDQNQGVDWAPYKNYFELILRFMPDDVVAQELLGFVDYYSGQQEKSVALFKSVFFVHEQNLFLSNYNLGVITYKKGMYPQAVEYLLKAIASNPQLTLLIMQNSTIYRQIFASPAFGYSLDERNGGCSK